MLVGGDETTTVMKNITNKDETIPKAKKQMRMRKRSNL